MLATPAYATDDIPPPPGNYYQISGSETGSYESNPLKIAHGATPLWGSTTTPELILQKDDGSAKCNLDTSVAENIYDHSAFDSTDVHSKAIADIQNERWDAGLTARLDYDTTRSSELTTFGLDLPDVRRFAIGATPDVGYHISPLDTVTLAATANRITYDNAAFIDYDVLSLNPSMSHQISPTDSIILTVNAQRYQTAGGPSNIVDTIGPTLGWKSTPTPRFTSTITAGFEHSAQTNNTQAESSNLNYVFSAELAYTDETDSGNLTATRSHQPFSNGTETLLNRITANATHGLTPLLALHINADYADAQYNPTANVNLNHEAGSGLELIYHMLDTLDATAGYRYSSQDLSHVSGTIADQSVLV